MMTWVIVVRVHFISCKLFIENRQPRFTVSEVVNRSTSYIICGVNIAGQLMKALDVSDSLEGPTTLITVCVR